MNHFRLLTAALLISLSLLAARCSTQESGDSSSAAAAANMYEDVDPESNTYTGAEYEYYEIDIPEQEAGASVSFDYTLDLDVWTKDVYFVFTNTSPSSTTWYPSIRSSSMAASQGATPESIDAARASLPEAGGEAARGTPEISEFNRKPWDFLDRINPVSLLLNSIAIPKPRMDIVGVETTFKTGPTTSVQATCRETVYNSNANRTLNIYVDDAQWTSTNEPGKVDDDMVDALADMFLKSGTATNDIYHWVTNIYGAEWGSVSDSSLEDFEENMLIGDNEEITILLYDIDNDEDNFLSAGGVVGYFWAKDNFKDSAISYSNERIMFYMDSVMLASPAGDWDITDKWPSIVVSTLAHEFQHMIHFYQKTVMRSGGVGSETWLDEMCAMATEDLVADKAGVGVYGPRGVADYTDGSDGNTNGRLPWYNYYNDISVTKWYSGDTALASYAINYAFGAYLSRNYGGAAFFRDVMLNAHTDEAAVESALEQNGGAGITFGQALRQWGIANLLSDQTDTDAGYRYNSDTPLVDFASTVGATPYLLGAINLFNYEYKNIIPPLDGPYIYDTMRTGFMPGTSNLYFRAGAGLSGLPTWRIKLKSGVRMSVVVRGALP